MSFDNRVYEMRMENTHIPPYRRRFESNGTHETIFLSYLQGVHIDFSETLYNKKNGDMN